MTAHSARPLTAVASGTATRPNLGDVLANISVVDLVCAPRGLDIPVGDPTIYDPCDALDADSVVLGVGVTVSAVDAKELLSRAGMAEAAAVVLKGPDADSLREAAQLARVALLTIPSEMTWSQAHTVWRTALTRAGVAGDERSDVPLGDLFGLANAVAAMVGGAVTIEDRQSRVLAYSSQSEGVDEPRRQTILGRRVPDEWLKRLEEAGVFQRLWAGEVVRYEAGPGFELRPRLAAAVFAGDTILGSIWVSEGNVPLDDAAENALREAARIAALHLIRYRASEDLERGARGDLLRSIFDQDGAVGAVAYRLGVPPDGTFAVLAFEPLGSDEVESALERERALDLVALYGEAFRNRSASVQLGRTIYVLLPGPDPALPQRLTALARDIVQRARESLGVELRAGIGSIVTNLRDAVRSKQEADQVLRALADEPGGGGVADFDSTRGRVALLALRDFAAERPEMRSRHIAELTDHDSEHGTNYVQTLREYLDAFGDVPRAAERANVHPNTFRYRLRRLVEVSGIDLHDPEERLLASLELRLGASRNGSQSGTAT